MPLMIDEQQRRQEIARATLKIADLHGANAVTIRAVADELGRSTAFVTNYVPSRAQLMFNALDYARGDWITGRMQSTEGLTGVERLVRLARWMCTTDEHDTALRSLWIEVVAGSGPEMKVVTDLTDHTFDDFRRSANEASLSNAEQIADILYLFARGFHVKNVEDPAAWNDDRANRALTVLLESLLAQNS